MSVSWVPVGIIGLFLVFGWLRLFVGYRAQKRQLAEQRNYAETYGLRLEEHHGSRTACEEAVWPLRQRIRALEARLDERDNDVVTLTEERDVLIASVEAMNAEDQTAGWPS